MNTNAPNGHFAKGLLLFGSLEKGGLVSKGFILQPPDMRGAQIGQLNAYQEKIRSFLSSLGEGQSAQFQWTCNCDYRQELTRYHRETQKVAHPYIRKIRTQRLESYWKRMHDRELRREQLVLFVSTKVTAYSGNLKLKTGLESHYEAVLGQLKAQYDELSDTLRTIFGSDTTIKPMGDLEHFSYVTKFLNPSITERPDFEFAPHFNAELSIQENCWNSDVAAFPKVGFYMDGHYHTVFTFKRWPSRTYPGIIYRLTGLPFLDYQLTINLDPLPAPQEVTKEEKAVERLRGEYEDRERHSLLVAIGKKERKIESLSTGFVRPFEVTYTIRVWGDTEAALRAKCAAIKNAVTSMGGAQYYECALPATAKNLFFASWPGWTGSQYRHCSLYAEDTYLADLLPFSATFTGHLAEAEAIYDGSQNNLVGLRTFLGRPATPQHTVLIGATGAGKSRLMRDLLEQTDPYFHYTAIIEEGLSYADYTKALGERPIILHPDGDLTVNYFDTGGMPLSQLQLASGVGLVSRMIGQTSDGETQQIRQAMLGQYIGQLYQDAFDDWSKRNTQKLPEIQRLACAVNRWREKLGIRVTELEAFSDLRGRLKENDDEAQQFVAAVSEKEITQFIKEPQTERAIMTLAHAYYGKGDYPTHASLVELLRFSRFSEHKKETVDHLATLLSAWCAHGQYGRLFDGQTNISLTGKIAHFELGHIPEQAIELKTAAGLLIAGFMRQHIISLPREQRKRILYEELDRFREIPGGEKIVSESYAQLRKFNCWAATAFQQASRLKNSPLRPVIFGNSKQFFLMRQFDRSDVDDIARDISLPESVCAAIQSYPMPEQQPEGNKFSSFCFFSPVTDPALCGTVRNIQPVTNDVHEKSA